MTPITTNTPPISKTSLPVHTVRPTASNPPPTSGGIEAFEGWLIERLCELESKFESYVTHTSTTFKHDRR